MKHSIRLLLLIFCICLQIGTAYADIHHGSNLIISDSSIRQDYALLFAFDDYQDPELNKLPEAYQDASALGKTLEAIYGFKVEIVRHPTKLQVYEKLTEYGKKAYGPNDQLLIFFSGIGAIDKSKEEGFLIPYDAKISDEHYDTWIPLLRLNRSIDALPCKHILVMLDSDFSSLFGIKYKLTYTSGTGPGDSLPRPGEDDKWYLLSRLKYKSRLYMSSSDNHTPQKSTFIATVLKSLQAPQTKDSLIAFEDIAYRLNRIQPRSSFGSFGSDEPGGTFLFIASSLNIQMPTLGKYASIPTLKGKIHVQEKSFKSRNGSNNIGEVYLLSVDLENITDSAILNIKVTLSFPDGVFPNSVSSMLIPLIKPYETKPVQFSFFVNELYQADNLSISLEVKADESRYIDFSEQFSIRLTTADCELPKRAQKDRALFFASNNYLHFDSLHHPVSEATAIAAELQAIYNFNVEIFANPTRTIIRDKIDEYSKKYQTGEFDSTGQLLIFFSGHGDFKDGVGYFLPSDADDKDLEGSAMAYPIWQRKIERINCRQILVVIDACFSGTFEEKIAAQRGTQGSENLEIRPEEETTCSLLANYNKITSLYSRKYLTAGGKEKTPDDSEFAEQLLNGLQYAKYNKKFVTVGDIYEGYLRNADPLPIFGEFGSSIPGSSFAFFIK